jgi:hypothetical protein
MKWTAKKRLQSVVGLTLADGHLEAVHVERAKGALAVVKTASAPMVLDLMHPEPELVGREIVNHLEAAGIRERHCVVGIPSAWVMTQLSAVPELSPEDPAGFLQIEAEKGFPCDPAALQIARSMMRSGASSYVNQFGVRKEQLEQLASVLKAAGLKPVSFSLALPTVPEVVTKPGSGRITAVLQPKGAIVLVSAGGGIAAYRTCESSIESDGGENVLNGSAVMRELRVTLEQLPADLRQEVRDIRLCGDDRLVDSISGRAAEWARGAGMGLVESQDRSAEIRSIATRSLATRWLENDSLDLEFLAERPGRWAAFMSRYSSKRLATAGMAAAAIAVLVLLAFGWLEFRRLSLRSTWGDMQAEVTALDSVQSKIREYRPWYDTSYRNLSIMRRVTESFPDNGNVTAKTVEIRMTGSVPQTCTVTVTGTARDNASLLKTLDQLRQSREVGGLKVEQIRATTPAQFTFSFHWNSTSGS